MELKLCVFVFLGKGETQAAHDAYEGHGGPKEGGGVYNLLLLPGFRPTRLLDLTTLEKE